MTKYHKIDSIDIQLLSILQEHGRTKRSRLAKEVGLSISSVSERLRKMEEAGYIRGYHAVLDPFRVDLGVTAFVFVRSESSRFYGQIVERASAHQEILECHAITGDGSHLIKLKTMNTRTLERVLSEIQAWPGVINTRTSIVLSTFKETTAVALTHLKDEELE